MIKTVLTITISFLLAGSIHAQFGETFGVPTNPTNPDGWKFWPNQLGKLRLGGHGSYGGVPVLSFTGVQVIVPPGPPFPTCIFWPSTDSQGHWSGDFREMRVSNISFDVWHWTGSSLPPVPHDLHIVLGQYKGSMSFHDDDMAYVKTMTTLLAPIPSRPVVPTSSVVPSGSNSLPAGWAILTAGQPSTNPDADWNDLITDVDYVAITIGVPTQPTVARFGLRFDNICLVVKPLLPLGSAGCFCSVFPPCGNLAGPEEGCENTSGSGIGGKLRGYGSNRIHIGTAYLHATQCHPGGFGVVLQSQTIVSPTPFGDGLRCLGSGAIRSTVMQADDNGEFTTFGAIPLPLGGAGVGAYHYQLWYRSPAGPCNSGFNLTNSLSADFL